MQTLVALNVMRDHDASDPQRKLELAELLASGTVTQAAVNHAGHCDRGERGGSCFPPPSPPPHPLAAPPLPQLQRLSSTPLSQRLLRHAF